jgi:hypothetical protein
MLEAVRKAQRHAASQVRRDLVFVDVRHALIVDEHHDNVCFF